jgi:hypothetical protein
MSSPAATVSAAQLLAALEAASPEELAAICTKLSVAKPSKSAAAGGGGGKPKKEAVPLPESEDGDAPDESAYRVAEEDIQEGVCDGRRLTEPDRRWKPAIYGEAQCGGAVKEDGLCATCVRRREKFAADPSPKVGWHGRLTEDPMDWAHMLGTLWAEKANPVWGAGSAAGSEVSGAPAAVAAAASAAASKAEKAAAKEAEKAQKAAAKEAEKAQKAAAKEAEKAQKAAAKEAEKKAKEEAKAAEKAKKEAEKAAAKKPAAAAKKAATPAAAGGGGAAAAPAAVPAKADTSAAAATATQELILIDGAIHAVKDGLVYAYDEVQEKVGAVLGRAVRTGDDVTIEPLPVEGEAASEADSGDLAL